MKPRFKSLLVTGGAGFIGSNFVRMALKRDPSLKVVNLDLLTYAGNLSSLDDVKSNPNHIFVKGDIRDAGLVLETMKANKVDCVVNFAAESHVDRSIEGPKVFLDTNVMGTMNLLQAARECGVERFVQVSTDEVYGSLGKDGKFTESSPISPNSPYSASKAAADHLANAWSHTFGLDAVVTRCSNNYGPYQFPEKMIPLCINNAMNDRPIPVYGDGMQVRDWLYVEDHCSAVWLAMENGSKGDVFNIGGCNEMPNIELVRTILSLLGKPESLITFVKDRPGHDRRYAIDPSKIMKSLGWKPSVDFKRGIALTVEWYKSSRKWLDSVTSGEYRNYYEKMYSGR